VRSPGLIGEDFREEVGFTITVFLFFSIEFFADLQDGSRALGIAYIAAYIIDSFGSDPVHIFL
jgi:hypothetical protein